MSSAHVSDAKTIASSSFPITSGRQPRGSRAAMRVSPMTMMRQYAPSTPSSASITRPSGVSAVERAMRCTSTSLSIDEAKIAPCSSSANRISVALMRFPLCARAMWPPRERASTGCAFSIDDEPAVL